MQSHVRVLAILHIVFGSLGLLTALGLLAVFGGITGIISMNASSDDAWIAAPLVGGIGAIVVGITAVLSVPSIIAGVGLLSYRPWARILTLVLSALLLFHVPFGTALGFYGFWVLMSREGSALFERAIYGYSRQ